MNRIIFLLSIASLVCSQTITREASPKCPNGPTCTVRTFYIAAVEEEWDYAPSGYNHIAGKPLVESDAYIWTVRYPNRIGSVYTKAVYHEYTNESFDTKNDKPEHLGILGPIIRAEVGDIIKVVYKNMASIPFGVHAHGVLYEKMDEAATYSNLDPAMKGTGVAPGTTHTYTWIVGDRAGPGPADGNSTLWAYHSHNSDPGDIYSGLYGPLIIYRPGILNTTTHLPNDVDKEFILHFLVFNENLSPYLRRNIMKYAPELADRLPSDENIPFELKGDSWVESNLQHAINGRMFGNLNGLDMKIGDKIRWHLMGFGTEVDIHTVHWHSQTVLHDGHRVDVVELLPATFKTVSTVADSVGRWLIHCHVLDHQIAGMDALYHVSADNDQFASLSYTSFLANKIAMNAPAAPRPPRAIPLTGLSAGSIWSPNLTHLILIWIMFSFW